MFKSTYLEEYLRTAALEDVFMKRRKIKIYKEFQFYIKETSENVCFYFMVGFPWSLYLPTIFLWCKHHISWVNQKKIKSSRKKYVVWTCFEFWPMKNIFRKL